jgi:gamma-glutamylcyclotransferase (GGCT)/AIG2-like uncharacterized protein YtfP
MTGMTPSLPLLPIRHVFVYGTLRGGEQRDINRLRPAPKWLGLASVDGVLLDLGEYPGLRLGHEAHPGHTKVKGEVYEITGELERLLDDIEGVTPQPNGEYVKREVQVILLPFPDADQPSARGVLNCLVYEVTPERSVSCPEIEGGDWIAFRLARRGRVGASPSQGN